MEVVAALLVDSSKPLQQTFNLL